MFIIDTQITEDDYICTACYNHHLFIVQNTKCRSTDEELEAQIQQTPDEWTQPHITAALKLIRIKLGKVLLRKLAVLFPSLYRFFVLLAIQEAEKSSMPMNESDIVKTVSKQNFFALIMKSTEVQTLGTI